ncbi:MAG: metallophosphoesterase [Candidatus Hydrogenedentota bacterium]
MKTVACVSDLHLFCRRSRAESYFEEIERAIQDSDIFVFNGDTFDFRWSIHSSVEETVTAAIGWLLAIVSNAPDCHFYYILGNHDNVQLFMDALDELCEALPNLEWHSYYVKLDTHLFLHGDVSNENMTASDLAEYRAEWLHEEQRGELPNRIYDVVFGLGIHKLVNRFAFPTEQIISRLQFYLEDIGEGQGSDTQRVFFGHTHVVVESIERNGQHFTNGGSPMQGIRFQVLRTEVPREHSVRGV